MWKNQCSPPRRSRKSPRPSLPPEFFCFWFSFFLISIATDKVSMIDSFNRNRYQNGPSLPREILLLYSFLCWSLGLINGWLKVWPTHLQVEARRGDVLLNRDTYASRNQFHIYLIQVRQTLSSTPCTKVTLKREYSVKARTQKQTPLLQSSNSYNYFHTTEQTYISRPPC